MLADPGYKFCPKCGGPLLMQRLKEFEPERLVCTKCGFVMYLNPKVAAGAVVEYKGGIVLLRRAIEPRRGFWVHPGGFVDRGETLEAAARRETMEEVGLDVELGRLLGAFSFPDSEIVVVTFAARVVRGVPIVGDECLEVATFAPEAIPWSEIAFPSTELSLREYLNPGVASIAEPGWRSHPSASAQSAALPLRDDRYPEARPNGVQPGQPSDREMGPLFRARAEAHRLKDVRAASLAYPALIARLREARRYREALNFAEEGLALTHDPLIARLADEVAHELAAAEQERC